MIKKPYVLEIHNLGDVEIEIIGTFSTQLPEELIRYRIIHTFDGTCSTCENHWKNKVGFDVEGVRVS